MQFEHRLVQADLVVVGAGVPGICAAIQAAREGLTVVLINDRGCVGGNSSQEICIPINGANDVNPFNINSREGGLWMKFVKNVNIVRLRKTDMW